MGERKEVTAEFIMECIFRDRSQNNYVENILRECAPFSATKILSLKIPLIKKFDIILRNEFFTDKELRLMACDFADFMLTFFEEKYPRIRRPRKAIHTSRLFADGLATEKQLSKASSAAFEAYEKADENADIENEKEACWSVPYSLEGDSRRQLVVMSAFVASQAAEGNSIYAAFESVKEILEDPGLFNSGDSYFAAYHKKAKKEVMKIVKRYIKAGGK